MPVTSARHRRYQRQYYYQHRDKKLLQMRQYNFTNKRQLPKDNKITRDYTPVRIYWN